MKLKEKIASFKMMKIISTKWLAKPIYVAAELGIADLLTEGPKSIEEIAEKTETYTPYLYRLMRTLASFGIFKQRKDKTFMLNSMAECLKTEVMRSIVLMFHSDWHDKAWNKLLQSIRTGKTAFDMAHGMSAFEWFKKNPEQAKVFNEANAVKAKRSHRAIVDLYNFKKTETVIDIGGGYGALLFEILKVNPHLKGIIADLPYVLKSTEQIIKKQKFNNRCTTIDCDFFQKIPAEGDLYIMSHILHDWDDQQCQVILKNCNKAMKKYTKLLIIEMIVPKKNKPSITQLLDIEVMVMGGGKERTKAEFNKLLNSTGFSLNKIISTKENIFIMECIKYN